MSELRYLLEAVSFDQRKDTVIFVGDLINKGPGSSDVIRFARQINSFAVRGNHDDQLLEAWYRVGRYSKGLENYKNDALYGVDCMDVAWLQALPLTLSFPWLNVVVAHAGLVPGVPLHSQKFDDLLWMRDVKRSKQDDDGTAWIGLQNPEDDSLPWVEAWTGPEHVIFGHDARRQLQRTQFATGIDSGCCYGNFLTALVMDPDEAADTKIVQQHAEKVHVKPLSAMPAQCARVCGA